jgi:ABC-type transporter Mla maintaining outer membrane lipid asymmetry ATPase subunit MlaF
VTGGGRFGSPKLNFSISPQIVTIDDPATKGVDYKADVKSVTRSGNMATVTAELRASIGMVTLVVVDGGEGAAATADALTFLVDGVVKANGAVADGNLQIHKDSCP